MNASPDIPELQTHYEHAMGLPARQRPEYLLALAKDQPGLARELRRLLDASASDKRVPPLIQFGDELLESAVHARAFEDGEEIITPVGPACVKGLVSDAKRIGRTEVYEVVLNADGRRVALKVLRSETSAGDLRRRFRVEALSHAKLDHPGVAPMLGAGASRGALGVTHAAIAMVFVDGETLDVWAQDTPIVPDVARVIADIARTIHYAHLRGIVHRDLKPRNIMVDRDGHARLLDLGVAKLTEEHASGVGQSLVSIGESVVGTPRYMAPEQFTPTKQAVDLRADVYALGCILYELVTGAPPVHVEGLSTVEAADAKRGAGVPEPRITGVPQDLIRCAAHACAANPAQRYQSCQDFAVDIERAVKGIPLIERPPGPGRRFGLLVLRHPRTSAMVVLLLIAGLAAMWVYVSLQHRVAQERDRAVARFEETRSFANWVIFDLDRMLSAMPGTADARRQLIDRANRTLDALTADPRADDDLLMSIIDARLRLADVLVWELGDLPGGEEQRKSVSTLLGSLDRPDTPEARVRKAWVNLFQFESDEEKEGSADDMTMDTIGVFRANESAGLNFAPYWRWRAEAEWKGTRRLWERGVPADELIALGEDAIAHADRAVELDSSDPFNTAMAANTRFWLAHAKLDLLEPDALTSCDKAIEAARKLCNLKHRYGLSYLARAIELRGRILAATGKPKDAVLNMIEAIQFHDAAVAAEPGNKSIFRRAEVSRVFLANVFLTLAQQGDREAAELGLEYIRSASEHLEHRIELGWFDEREGDYRNGYHEIEQDLIDSMENESAQTP